MQHTRVLASKRVINIALSCVFTLIISACDNDKTQEIKQNIPKQEVEESSVIILSEDGVGPINASTPFNMHKMTVAFSQYSVVEETNFTDGRPFSAIRISEGVNTIMNIIPNASQQGIYSIIVEDNIIKNGLGHPLGTRYKEIYSYGQDEKCQLGAEDMSGKVICYAPTHPNILYVFNGNTNVIASTIPPADILQGWALELIIWRPKT